jgi:predicted nucleic acid-binding protein
MDRVLRGPAVLELDEDAARRFGAITARPYRLGRPAGDLDVLVAAVALAHGQSLVTRNPKHFADLPGLTVHAY